MKADGLLEAMKVCSRCKQTLPLERFGSNKAAPDGLDWYCLEDRRSYKRQYRTRPGVREGERRRSSERWRADLELNRRLQREYWTEHPRTDAQKREACERSRLWRESHPEQYRQQMREWRQNNRLKYRESRRRYKIRKKDATVGVVSYEEILERDGFWCYLCETDVDPTDVHFDHVVPLSKGGEHSMDNIKVTHSTCNLRKNDRLLDEVMV